MGRSRWSLGAALAHLAQSRCASLTVRIKALDGQDSTYHTRDLLIYGDGLNARSDREAGQSAVRGTVGAAARRADLHRPIPQAPPVRLLRLNARSAVHGQKLSETPGRLRRLNTPWMTEAVAPCQPVFMGRRGPVLPIESREPCGSAEDRRGKKALQYHGCRSCTRAALERHRMQLGCKFS